MALPTRPTLLDIVVQNEQGMTLIELLASLSLIAILLAVLSQFLYSGVRLWGKDDQAYERRRQLLVISQTLSTDLASLVNSPYLAEPAMKGDEYGFDFWRTTHDGLVQINYRFDQSEGKVFKSAGFWGSKPQENPIFTQVKEWKIEYFRLKTKNWESDWQPTDNKTDIPSLIRITFRVGTNNQEVLVIPIKAYHSESDTDGT
jgi:prepilin-type N-terminal cleavage/methylation domain-containing protein